MFPDTINPTNKVIESLVHELYPAIQHQFILISSANDLSNTDNSHYERIYELLNDLKAEFQSLTTYENRLVFPSVLKVFDRKEQGTQHPNISALQQLTEGKEHRLLQLTDELSVEVEKSDLGKTPNSINELIRLFKNDFAEQKSKWNKIITNLQK